MLGVIANQRFLGHTNPIMTAAVADGGSILDREYVQRVYRGVHDAGHADNLKLWVCAGLPKLRNSGGVDYVPELYDLSGNGNNGVQATEANQPRISSSSLVFARTTDTTGESLAISSNPASLQITDNLTAMCWFNATSINDYGILSKYTNTLNQRSWAILILGGYLTINLSSDGTFNTGSRKQYRSTNTVTAGEDYHVAFTFANNVLKLYINGSEDTTVTKTYDDSMSTIYNTSAPVRLSGYEASSTQNTRHFIGSIDDSRVYGTTALTATEIAAIYNQTSYRYA
jgi:hypothetical protein